MHERGIRNEIRNFVNRKILPMSFLFHDVIFGPVHSRRLGVSLGINLLPVDKKFCTFNCIYCECGWTEDAISGDTPGLPKREHVIASLEAKLQQMQSEQRAPDAITFAGNGEPTIHPEFPEIMEDVIRLRDTYFPEAKVTVLSNSSTLHKPAVFNALKKAGDSVMKLDAGTEETFRTINGPQPGISLATIVDKLMEFEGQLIIQTLFLRGYVDGKPVDNTLEPELAHWLRLVRKIRPKYVMIYPIDRATPNTTLEKVSFEELKRIAERVEEEGIMTQVFY
jgi:wyosine [tRNA(Phe)-imidazoG37] synthetase (radical SAM superfamily)